MPYASPVRNLSEGIRPGACFASVVPGQPLSPNGASKPGRGGKVDERPCGHGSSPSANICERLLWMSKHKRPIVPRVRIIPTSSMNERPAKPLTLPARQEASLRAPQPGKDGRHGPNGSNQRAPNRRVGPGDERLLDLLVRPMRGDELARQLNLSRQRIHQLVVKLLALG